MTLQERKDRAPADWEKASHLGRQLEFQGEVQGKENLIIEGRLRGTVRLTEADVLVAEQALAQADIQARDVTVKGEVIGNIVASGRVLIEQTGRLTGDLAASVVSIEDGARFKGTIKILGKT